MKTRKKLLIALLSASCLTAGAFAFTACEEDAPVRDPALNAAYQTYVTETGEGAKSYEDWIKDVLATIGKAGADGTSGTNGKDGKDGKDGEDGAPGKSAYDLYVESLKEGDTKMSQADWLTSLVGAKGENGENGENGIGIKSIVEGTDENAGKLVITYSDDSTTTIDLPDSFTHEHKYGDSVVLIAPTSTSDGIAYKTCEADGHIELSVISCYGVKVLNYDGSPVKGIEVTIGETTITTDLEGNAVFGADLELGNYNLTVTDPSGEYVCVDTLKTFKTGDKTKFTVQLAKKPKMVETNVGYKYVISGAGVYCVNVGGDLYIELQSPEKDRGITVSANTEAGWRYPDQYAWDLEAGDYSVDVEKGQIAQLYYGSETERNLVLTVTYGDPVNKKGSLAFPINMELGENKDTIETEGGVGLFAFNGTLMGEKDSQIKITTDAEIYYIGAWSDDEAAGNLAEATIETATPYASGDIISLNNYNKNYFFIKSATPEVNYTIDKYYAPGSYKLPHKAMHGQENTATSDVLDYIWFEYDVDAEKDVTFVLTSAYSLEVYDNNRYDGEGQVYMASGQQGSVTLTAGKYYLKVSAKYAEGNYNATFTVRDYVEATDVGFDETRPIALTDGTQSDLISTQNTSMYFTVPVQAGYGRLKVEVVPTDSAGNVDSDFYNEIFVNYIDNNSSNLYDLEAAGDANFSVYIDTYNLTNKTAYYKVTATYTPITAAYHTFTIMTNDYATVANQKVELWLNGEKVAGDENTKTYENGAVTFNVPYAAYTVKLPDLDETTYKYSEEYTVEVSTDDSNDAGGTYYVYLETKANYTVNITGITDFTDLKVQMYYTETILDDYGRPTGTKDVIVEEKPAAASVVFNQFKKSDYQVRVVGYDEETYGVVVGEFGEYSTTCEVTFGAMVAYTVTVNDAENNPLVGVDLSITDALGNTATATTGEGGVATFEQKLMAGVYKITCSGSAIPAGYQIKGETAANSNTVTLTATEKPSGNPLPVGEAVALTPGEELVFVITDETAGNYEVACWNSTFSITVEGEGAMALGTNYIMAPAGTVVTVSIAESEMGSDKVFFDKTY